MAQLDGDSPLAIMVVLNGKTSADKSSNYNHACKILQVYLLHLPLFSFYPSNCFLNFIYCYGAVHMIVVKLVDMRRVNLLFKIFYKL